MEDNKERFKMSFGKKDIAGLDKFAGIKNSEFIAIPLTEAFIHSFLEGLETSDAKELLCITDFRHNKQAWYGDRFVSCYYDCDFITDGKVVRVTTWGRTDIDVNDMDESWYCVDSITFSGDKACVDRFYSNLLIFVNAQDIDEMMDVAKKSLLEGKFYHLSFEMCKFYDL